MRLRECSRDFTVSFLCYFYRFYVIDVDETLCKYSWTIKESRFYTWLYTAHLGTATMQLFEKRGNELSIYSRL